MSEQVKREQSVKREQGENECRALGYDKPFQMAPNWSTKPSPGPSPTNLLMPRCVSSDYPCDQRRPSGHRCRLTRRIARHSRSTFPSSPWPASGDRTSRKCRAARKKVLLARLAHYTAAVLLCPSIKLNGHRRISIRSLATGWRHNQDFSFRDPLPAQVGIRPAKAEVLGGEKLFCAVIRERYSCIRNTRRQAVQA